MNATRAEKIAELERELAYRQWVYPKQIRSKKMSIREASKRLRVMQEILDDYKREGDLFGMKENPQWNR